ncbi:hypothetical protein QZH41_018420 [Actinostola sp. cb2023]|nr:hypothetical protein QZH41_018420 [Actinostola sp. cb2023]
MDPSSPVFSHQLFDWNDMDQALLSLSCRCAVVANHKGYTYFSLQNYGECWSGKDANSTYADDGPSTTCIGAGYERCGGGDTLCTGVGYSNFVYMVKGQTSLSQSFNSPPCDDNYPICAHYSAINLCNKEFPQVLQYCKKSCKLC